jgi:hypothetical protein
VTRPNVVDADDLVRQTFTFLDRLAAHEVRTKVLTLGLLLTLGDAFRVRT